MRVNSVRMRALLNAQISGCHVSSRYATLAHGYIIRTTDRNGNSWTSETRYSAVVRLLTELKQKRDITDLL